MEKINIAEILKNCPKGMDLDCILFDDDVTVIFDGVDGVNEYATIIKITVIHDGNRSNHTLTKYGQWNPYKYAKCVIFPKGKTSWEGFVPPVEFKDGDILCNSKTKRPFILKFFDLLNNNVHSYCGIDGSNKFYTSSNNWAYASDVHLATEEEKKKLFDAIKANGFKWNPETKTLEKLIKPKFKVGDKIVKKNSACAPILITKISDGFYYSNTESSVGVVSISVQDEYELVPNKFDISTLIPFESRVLVRDTNSQDWTGSFYSHYNIKDQYPFYCIDYGKFKQCIPYEGNEHLLGKTNDCDNFYKTWE